MSMLYLVNYSLGQFIDCLGLWLSFYQQLREETARKLKVDARFSLFEHEEMYKPILKKLKEVDPKSMRERKVSLSDYCRADKPPQKGENGESICPATAKKEQLYVLCSGTDFMEVITGVLQKKPKAANEELLEALNHYLQTGNLG